MMAQLVAYGGEEGVECVVYNVSYGVTQQLSQSPQQTGHETGETDTAEYEPCYEEIDTATAADRKTTVVQKLSACDLKYEQIQEIMYTTAVSQPEEDSPKMKEKCGDWCCSSAICIDKIDYKTPVFRRARAMGWKIYAHTLFPLMGNKLCKFLIYSQLVTILMTLIFSIVTISKAEFDVVFLVVALIGSLLAAADATFNLLTSCHIFEYYCKNNKGRTERGNDQESGNPTTEEPRTSSEGAASATFEQCRKYTSTAVNTVDVLRIIASEIVLYVLLMCSIFKFQTHLDTLSLVLLLISAVSFVIFVYVVRIVIILRAIAHTQRMRKPPQDGDRTSSVQFYHSISRSSKALQGYFVYHSIMQMLLQAVMVVVVAIRIRYEKYHIVHSGHVIAWHGNYMYENYWYDSYWYDSYWYDTYQYDTQSGHMDDGMSVSGYLWFMMVGGYVLPTCGYLTFFIVTFHWVQEFPIGLCIDMITILQLSQGNISANLQANSSSANLQGNATTYQEKIRKITEHFKTNELKEKFKCARNFPFLSKLLYPLFSPTMVVLCTLFAGLHAAIAIFIPREDYLFAFICCSTIVNAFTFTVGFIWSGIVIAIATVLVVVF